MEVPNLPNLPNLFGGGYGEGVFFCESREGRDERRG